MDGWMDGWVDGWMGGWMDGWMGGWINLQATKLFIAAISAGQKWPAPNDKAWTWMDGRMEGRMDG